jgi:hypothetical protein
MELRGWRREGKALGREPAPSGLCRFRITKATKFAEAPWKDALVAVEFGYAGQNLHRDLPCTVSGSGTSGVFNTAENRATAEKKNWYRWISEAAHASDPPSHPNRMSGV